MAGRPYYRDAVDRATGGKLREIMAYERAMGTSNRKIAKVLADQFGVTVSSVAVERWCAEWEIPFVKVSRSRRNKTLGPMPPLPPEALERGTDGSPD